MGPGPLFEQNWLYGSGEDDDNNANADPDNGQNWSEKLTWAFCSCEHLLMHIGTVSLRSKVS